ncbi:hypothetical protein DM02DRAFT_263980 [Periconia macrospinosa]|uniref:C2H2-type domain-containing protein n=1 Tax=Periconia macrospinosa TaxID=97972 RepID=A0A2V1DYQ2_9PLEO|nr:hypothetical protein DM02DRAFT_263980 [Periconia macrospinosa]
MYSRGQPTPPFNSPYQQAIKPNPLLHTPAYPSPARSDSEASRYHADGLGLYDFPHAFSGPSVSQHNAIMFPPSPHPTETWTNMSNGPSPMIQQEPIVDPWTSGAYDHPVIDSPEAWAHYEDSHKSSLPSPREASIISGDGSEHGMVRVKLERGSGWTSDDDVPPLGTVAPGKLLNGNPYSRDYPHSSPMMMPKYEHTPERDGGNPVSLARQARQTIYDETPRTRKRNPKSASGEAKKYTCELCGKGFIRRYNKNTHVKRHQPDRQKLHNCLHPDCTMKFDRKTDLDRHVKSVHDKIRDLVCAKCGDAFSRKDTLRRHQEDGCEKKNQLSPSQVQQARSMRAASNAYYHSPRPDLYPVTSSGAPGYHPAEATGYDSRSPAFFRSSAFGGHPGY